MKTGCSWCLDPAHELATCSKAAALRVLREHGVVDPMASEEVNDQLALRFFQIRAALRGALADLHAAGLEPSQVTKDLIPANEGLDL